MECSRCSAKIEEGEARERFEQMLCEDCYMDSLSPTLMCDPWATHSAKSFADRGQIREVTENQAIILKVLQENGIVEPEFLNEKIIDHMTLSEGERECAALLRMEMITIEKKDNKILIQRRPGSVSS